MHPLRRLAPEWLRRRVRSVLRPDPRPPIRLDHAPRLAVRWGHGQPPHPQIAARLARHSEAYRLLLDEAVANRHLFDPLPEERPDDDRTPYLLNGFFGAGDAAVLMTMLVKHKPGTYFEIGSGNSTKFARYVIDREKLPTRIVSLDPAPRAEIDRLCDRVVRAPLETVDLSIFAELESGDILFFDGSHLTFQNSDVTVFMLSVMPILKAGVIVHIHDIHWPADYPPQWMDRYYSEQYMLGAMLLCPEPPFEVLMPNAFVWQTPDLQARLQEATGNRAKRGTPGSFWIRMR